MLLCALSLAKEEIFWYFRHVKAPLPKNFAKKANEDEFRDSKISELIYLVVQFSELINKHRKRKYCCSVLVLLVVVFLFHLSWTNSPSFLFSLSSLPVVQWYYLEYLSGADRMRLNELCNSTFLASVGAGITQISKSVLEELSTISVDAFKQGREYDFKVIPTRIYLS